MIINFSSFIYDAVKCSSLNTANEKKWQTKDGDDDDGLLAVYSGSIYII